MKKNLKKILAAGLATSMVMSTGMVALAEKTNQEASFTKTYNATKTGTESPAETFTFTFTADRLTDSNKQLTKENMPEIPDSEITYGKGGANVSATAEAVSVALSGITWPGVGVYYYTVEEKKGKTAGVTYDTTDAYLKVTVAYDEGTDTYYTAFVTLNLADVLPVSTGADDPDGDGITDVKVGGFVNEYTAGSLAVTKQVTGNLGDINQYFEINVEFTSPEDGSVVMSDIFWTGGSTLGNVDHTVSGIAIEADTDKSKDGVQGWTGTKKATIFLNDDDTVTFTNIPAGVTYKVIEENYTKDATKEEYKLDYEPAVYENSDANEKNKDAGTISKTVDNDGKITAVDADTVTITNTKGTVVDTGISLDSMPYLMTLALSAMGALGFVSKKRKEEDEI